MFWAVFHQKNERIFLLGNFSRENNEKKFLNIFTDQKNTIFPRKNDKKNISSTNFRAKMAKKFHESIFGEKTRKKFFSR